MTRAVLYARYSTDRQRKTSIVDQLRLCRQRAADLGLSLAALESKRAEIQQQHALRNAVRTPTSKDIKAAVKAITLDLQSALNQDVQRARGLILGLFGRITVSQADGITALTFDEPHAALMAASGLSLGMVAGAGFVIRRRTIRL